MTEVPGVTAQHGWRMVARRFAALVAGEGTARVAGFLIVLVLARRLGPDGFGVVTLGLTLVAWFAYIVDSGTELLAVRDVAREPTRFHEITGQMLGLRLVLSVFASAVFVAGVLVFARSDYTRHNVALFAACLPAIALNLRWMVLGVGGSRAVAAGIIAGRLLVLAGVLLAVADATDTYRVPLLEAGGELLYAAVILAFIAVRMRPVWPKADLTVWRATIRQSSPLMVSSIARATIWSFDVLVISLALGPHDLGIYGVAIRPVAFVASAIGLFSLSFLSAFSATAADEEAALHGKALRVSLATCVLAAAALALGSLFVPFVFGDAYRDAVPVLAVLAWRIPFAAVGAMYSTVLVARDRQRTLMHNGIVVAVITIVLDLAAILAFGLIGAAAASIVSAALLCVLNYRSVTRHDPELRAAFGSPRS